jgi:hypothetical protein
MSSPELPRCEYQPSSDLRSRGDLIQQRCSLAPVGSDRGRAAEFLRAGGVIVASAERWNIIFFMFAGVAGNWIGSRRSWIKGVRAADRRSVAARPRSRSLRARRWRPFSWQNRASGLCRLNAADRRLQLSLRPGPKSHFAQIAPSATRRGAPLPRAAVAHINQAGCRTAVP